MCGRFTTDTETDEEELSRILSRAANNTPSASVFACAREVFPSDPAAVLYRRDPARLTQGSSWYGTRFFRWGYPMDRKLLINARAENAEERPVFCASLVSRRCIIPTAGFFEWTHTKEKVKYRFNTGDSGLLFLAGLYRPSEQPDPRYPDIRHEFVILTTEANASMAPVHTRMPVILRPDQLRMWLYSETDARRILTEPPPELHRKAVI